MMLVIRFPSLDAVGELGGVLMTIIGTAASERSRPDAIGSIETDLNSAMKMFVTKTVTQK